MQAGLLDTQITILRPEISRNEFGEQTEEYKPHYKTKARVLHNSGQRDIENGEILHNYIKTIEIWQYVGITETDWIEYDGKKYRIIEIEPDKRQMKKIIRIELVNE